MSSKSPLKQIIAQKTSVIKNGIQITCLLVIPTPSNLNKKMPYIKGTATFPHTPKQPLSYSQIKEATNLTDTTLTYSLKYLLEQKAIEKILIDGKIRYIHNISPEIQNLLEGRFTAEDQIITAFALHNFYHFQNAMAESNHQKPKHEFQYQFITYIITDFIKKHKQNTELISKIDATLHFRIKHLIDTTLTPEALATLLKVAEESQASHKKEAIAKGLLSGLDNINTEHHSANWYQTHPKKEEKPISKKSN